MADDDFTEPRPALSSDLVVDAALALTREAHLFGWSIRDLTDRLGVAPSVVYHHVGGKDLIARHVVERVFDGVAAPRPDPLRWRDWFRELLADLYPRLERHPGVAKWALMHGPAFPGILSIVGTGVALLERAGFGASAGLAYATVLNTAFMTVTVGDDRLLHEDDGPRDHAAMMTEFRAAAAADPGVSAMVATLLAPFAEGGEAAEQMRRRSFDFVTETVLAGLAAHLAADTLPAEAAPPGTREATARSR